MTTLRSKPRSSRAQLRLQDLVEPAASLVRAAFSQQVKYLGVNEPLEDPLPLRLRQAGLRQHPRPDLREPGGEFAVLRPQQPLQLSPDPLGERGAAAMRE